MRSAKVSSSATLSSSSVEISESARKISRRHSTVPWGAGHTSIGIVVVVVLGWSRLLGLEGLVHDFY